MPVFILKQESLLTSPLKLFQPRVRSFLVGALVFVLLIGWAVAVCPAERRPVRVRRAIDGDTLILADNTRLRLIGLDAPEMGREGRADKPWARAARQRLADLVGGRVVACELDEERHDRYGRLLGYLFWQGRFINEVILEEGLAHVFIVGPSTRYAERLIAAERRARAAGRGLWADWPGRWP